MSAGANTAYWFFGICYAGSIAVMLISLESMRKQLNVRLPENNKVNCYPPKARSFGELFSKSHLLAHYMELMKQHRELLPSSSLPDACIAGLAGCVVSFIGIVVSAAIG